MFKLINKYKSHTQKIKLNRQHLDKMWIETFWGKCDEILGGNKVKNEMTKVRE